MAYPHANANAHANTPDIESLAIEEINSSSKHHESTNMARVETYDTTTTQGKLQLVASKLKIEQQGIERVLEENRTDTSYWNIGSMVHPLSKLDLYVHRD